MKLLKVGRVPFPPSICSFTFGSAPYRKTVYDEASQFCHRSKQRKLHVCFLPFEYSGLPPLSPSALACRDILNTPIEYYKKYTVKQTHAAQSQ